MDKAVWLTAILIGGLSMSGVTAVPDAGTPKKPIPVILDTDIGSDIDDTWALIENYRIWSGNSKRWETASSTLYDCVAVYLAFGPRRD